MYIASRGKQLASQGPLFSRLNQGLIALQRSRNRRHRWLERDELSDDRVFRFLEPELPGVNRQRVLFLPLDRIVVDRTVIIGVVASTDARPALEMLVHKPIFDVDRSYLARELGLGYVDELRVVTCAYIGLPLLRVPLVVSMYPDQLPLFTLIRDLTERQVLHLHLVSELLPDVEHLLF